MISSACSPPPAEAGHPGAKGAADAAPRTIALTGGTGFIGRHVVEALLRRGHRLQALTRRPEALGPTTEGLKAVAGSLEDGAALDRLVDGADSLIHLAGSVAALHPVELEAVNRDGTARLARHAREAGIGRFVLVSSLAARTPTVSAYARSKREAEEAAAAALLGAASLSVIRPPAVYGPGDRATLPLFRGLARGFLPVPAGGGRFSLIHARDLAELLAVLLEAGTPAGAALEPDDGRSGGYDWPSLLGIAGEVLGRRVWRLPVPRWALLPVALSCDGLARWRGRPTMLSRDKLGELYHADWVARGDGPAGWRPRIGFHDGLPETLAWYRAQGWL